MGRADGESRLYIVDLSQKAGLEQAVGPVTAELWERSNIWCGAINRPFFDLASPLIFTRIPQSDIENLESKI